MVGFCDILPTLADAAGIPVPTGRVIDGKSFLPVLTRKGKHQRKVAFLDYDFGQGTYGAPKYSGRRARDQRYKVYEYAGFMI